MSDVERAVDLQRAYYRGTAARYDGMPKVASTVSLKRTGVTWGYSVFDSRPILADACDEVIMIPTVAPHRRPARRAQLRFSHLLICGFRNPAGPGQPPPR